MQMNIGNLAVYYILTTQLVIVINFALAKIDRNRQPQLNLELGNSYDKI